ADVEALAGVTARDVRLQYHAAVVDLGDRIARWRSGRVIPRPHVPVTEPEIELARMRVVDAGPRVPVHGGQQFLEPRVALERNEQRIRVRGEVRHGQPL